MEALLQTRGRDAGAARAGGLPAWIDRVVADIAARIFDRRGRHHCAVAVDADRDQAHQRCAAGDGARSSRAANARARPQMGRAPRRAHRIGRARNACFPVGMYVALSAPLMTIDLPNEAAAGVRYAYKASLIGAAHQFELTDDGLSWRIAGRSAVWPYAGISAIRLSYRPVSMQSRRFRADIENADGARIGIVSTSWQTSALMAPQDQDYRAFIALLHQRMARAGSRAALFGGLRPRVYAAA